MHQSISHYAQTDRPHRYKYRNIRHLILIHFINFWARSISATWCTAKVTHSRHTSHTTGHSTAWHTTHSGHTSWRSSALCTIRGSNNWSPHFLNFLSLRLKFLSFRIWIRIDPINRFLHQILHFFLIIILNHVLKLGIVQRIPHLIRHILQLILRLNRLPLLLIFRLILLRIRHNFINLIFAQSSLIRINGNFRRIRLILFILRAHAQNTIGIQIKCHLNLRYTTWCRRYAHQLKFTQLIIILRQLTLSLVHLNQYTRLIIRIRRKCLIRFARDGLIPFNQFGHHTAGSLNSKRQWRHIQQQQVTRITHFITRQNSSLNGSAIRHSLIGIDTLARIFSVKILFNHRLNSRNSRGTAHQNNLINVRFAHLGILQHFGHRLKTLTEVMHAQILETCSRNRRSKVNTIIQ